MGVFKILLRDSDAQFPLEPFYPWGGIQNLSLKGWLLCKDITHILLLWELHVGIGWNYSVKCSSTHSIQAANGVWPYLENRMPDFLSICAQFTLLSLPFPKAFTVSIWLTQITRGRGGLVQLRQVRSPGARVPACLCLWVPWAVFAVLPQSPPSAANAEVQRSQLTAAFI